jgi:hypothetical protein
VASKKQRRRREKLQRHEYEYVLETEEGEEVIESPRDPESVKAGNGKPAKASSGPLDRHGKPLAKPTWRRVLRRAAIFTPLIAIFVYITAGDLTVAGLILNVALLMAFFIPLSYVVDLVVYRMLWRRWEKERAAKRGR